MPSKIKKCINQSIDDLLLKYGIDKDVKLFGNPIEDFDFDNMSINEIRNIRKLLSKKIDNKLIIN
jgi:hypothetical protein